MAGEEINGTAGAAGGSELAKEAPAPGAPVPPDQPQPRGDRLAAILQKQASGGTLTASERGSLGGVKASGNRKARAAAAAKNPLLETPRPTPAAAAPADNPLFEPETIRIPVAENPPAGFDFSAADSEVIRNAAEAILDSMDTTTKLYIGYEARKAGCDEATVARYESAVALNVRNRQLMAENSQPVVLALCKFFRCQPDKLAATLKNSAFLCGLFAHVTAVAATVKSIKESQKERPAA